MCLHHQPLSVSRMVNSFIPVSRVCLLWLCCLPRPSAQGWPLQLSCSLEQGSLKRPASHALGCPSQLSKVTPALTIRVVPYSFSVWP